MSKQKTQNTIKNIIAWFLIILGLVILGIIAIGALLPLISAALLIIAGGWLLTKRK